MRRSSSTALVPDSSLGLEQEAVPDLKAPMSLTVTLKDVALRAGVDKGSASVVLNGSKSNTGVSSATRERILQAARELNYQPNSLAQRLATGYASKHIDLFALMLDAGIGVEKIKGIQALLMNEGFDVPVHSYDFYGCRPDEDERKLTLIRALRHQRPRAIVCATPNVEAPVLAELENFIQEGGIAVCYDDEVGIACDNVVFDVEANIIRACEHLFSFGHRRIGLYQQGKQHPVGAVLRGYQCAHKARMWDINSSYLFGNSQIGEEGGALVAADFLAMSIHERPTAMILINDRSAWAFCCELNRAGLAVPQDVSVVGHDDLALARFAPVPLTSVSHPHQQISEKVVELLLDRLIRGYNVGPRKLIVRGELIPRSSVSPPSS